MFTTIGEEQRKEKKNSMTFFERGTCSAVTGLICITILSLLNFRCGELTLICHHSPPRWPIGVPDSTTRNHNKLSLGSLVVITTAILSELLSHLLTISGKPTHRKFRGPFNWLSGIPSRRMPLVKTFFKRLKINLTDGPLLPFLVTLRPLPSTSPLHPHYEVSL